MISFKITGKELADELGKIAGQAATEAIHWENECADGSRAYAANAYIQYRNKARRFNWLAGHVCKDEMYYLTETQAKHLELF